MSKLNRTFTGLLMLLAAALIAAPAWAQAPASATATPATAPEAQAAEPGEPQTITITGVEGLVQTRAAEEKPWGPAKVGMVLGQGAEFRTGPRSAVRFVIPPDQVVTLDRLGTMKVLTAIRSARKVKTDLGMKYGRTRYDIEGGGIEHDSVIRSSSGTLSVRGTKVSLTDQVPFPPAAASLTGRARFKAGGKRETAFGDHQPVEVDADHPDAASHSLASTINPSGVGLLALTPLEYNLWANYPVTGVALTQQFVSQAHAAETAGAATTVGTTLLTTGPTFPSPIPFPIGSGNILVFVVSGIPPNALELMVFSPLHELLANTGSPSFNEVSPQPSVASGGFFVSNRSPVAGKTDYLQAGVWVGTNIPSGTYTYGVANSGTTPTDFRVDVVVGTRQTHLFLPNAFTGTAAPNSGYTTTQVTVH